jgi:hypothetical protein
VQLSFTGKDRSGKRHAGLFPTFSAVALVKQVQDFQQIGKFRHMYPPG